MAIADVASRRYAAALLDVAVERGLADRCLLDLESFRKQVQAAPDLRDAFLNPSVPAESAARAVTAVCQRMALHEVPSSFLALLASRRRLGRLDLVISAYRDEVDRRAGRARGELVTAGVVAPAQVSRLRDAIGAALKQRLELTQKRDPGLLAGIRVTVGDKVFDLSARTYLDSLRTHLVEHR